MKRINVQEAELLAVKFRIDNGFSRTEPLDVKIVLRKCNIQAMFRPMSDNAYGMSLKSKDGDMFVLVNSSRTIGRQNFTIAHELFHLLYDDNPRPHVCGTENDSIAERNANLFAAALLMPHDGLLQCLTSEECMGRNIDIATVLRLEQLYGVSRQSMLYRLRSIGLIDEKHLKDLLSLSPMDTAREYGYDVSLYLSGNEGLVISDFGLNAKKLYDRGIISEGHYMELINMIS